MNARTLLLTTTLCILFASCAHDDVGRRAQDIEVRHDVEYSPTNWPQPVFGDLYLPARRGRAPGVIMVHGGGWDGRDRSDMSGLSEMLAEHGYAVLNIDYRLAPAFRYPAPLEDIEQAAHWMRSHVEELGIDADRLGGWGYSAGAHLIWLAASRDKSLHAVIAGGMPSDLTRYPHSPLITAFIGATFQQRPDLWRQASPIDQVASASPPTFLYHGTWDQLVDFQDSVAMKARLDAMDVEGELRAVHGLGHLATFALAWDARRDAVAFLDRNLR